MQYMTDSKGSSIKEIHLATAAACIGVTPRNVKRSEKVTLSVCENRDINTIKL